MCHHTIFDFYDLRLYNMPEVKLFSCAASRNLADSIAEHYQTALGDNSLYKFSDGEMQTVINESVRGSFVFLIQSTCQPHDNLVELLLWIDCAKRASAGYITAVIPYFGYARQDRKDKPRVPISAKLMANLLTTAGADRVMTMDLHADQVQGFFDIILRTSLGVICGSTSIQARSEMHLAMTPDEGWPMRLWSQKTS